MADSGTVDLQPLTPGPPTHGHAGLEFPSPQPGVMLFDLNHRSAQPEELLGLRRITLLQIERMLSGRMDPGSASE